MDSAPASEAGCSAGSNPVAATIPPKMHLVVAGKRYAVTTQTIFKKMYELSARYPGQRMDLHGDYH